MTAIFRHYTPLPGIGPDYRMVRDMLVTRGICEFTYARWDWATTHGCLDTSFIGRMGIWLENDRAVAATLCDCHPGTVYLMCLPGYEYLRPEMLTQARRDLRGENGELNIVIPETDRAYQAFAAASGLTPTPESERDAAFFIGETPMTYALPEGFGITDMAKRYDMYQYGRVLWKGFNHEADGEGAFDPEKVKCWRAFDGEMLRENLDLSLKIAVTAPDGNFCAYCGMWYEPKAGFAVIEPVACDPQYRRMGLARAAVIEGIRRVAAKGARMAVVGSDQQFYYSIGLRPYATHTFWTDKA